MGIETLVGLSLATTVAGGAVSAIGAQQTAAANKASALYQAQVAENNATIASQTALRQDAAGQEAAKAQSLKTGQLISAQRAALAAAGVDVNSGTAVDDQVSAAMTGRLDALHIIDQSAQQVFSTKTQSSNYSNEASVDRAKAANASRAGDINTLSSLVGSAGSFSNKWAGFTKTGAVPSFSFGED